MKAPTIVHIEKVVLSSLFCFCCFSRSKTAAEWMLSDLSPHTMIINSQGYQSDNVEGDGGAVTQHIYSVPAKKDRPA